MSLFEKGKKNGSIKPLSEEEIQKKLYGEYKPSEGIPFLDQNPENKYGKALKHAAMHNAAEKNIPSEKQSL